MAYLVPDACWSGTALRNRSDATIPQRCVLSSWASVFTLGSTLRGSRRWRGWFRLWFGWCVFPNWALLVAASEVRFNQTPCNNAIMAFMAKIPGDGAVENGIVQINVRLHSNLYIDACRAVNEHEDVDSLSQLVRDGIISRLEELNERI